MAELYVIDVFESGLCGWRCLRETCGEYAGPYGSEATARSGAVWHQRRHEHRPGAGMKKLAEVIASREGP